MAARTTRKMSDRHEEDLAEVLDGARTRNSGAVWSDQGDGHQTSSEGHYRFTWDGKSTCGKSIGVTTEMWEKITEQSRGLEPAIPLRWYANDRLTEVALDLIAIDLDTFAQMQADANAHRLMQEIGCASGTHDFAPQESSAVPGMMTIGPCRGCGRDTYDAGYPYTDN